MAVDHGLADVVCDLRHGLVPMIMSSQMWARALQVADRIPVALVLEVELRELHGFDRPALRAAPLSLLRLRRPVHVGFDHLEAAGLVEAGDAAQAAAWDFLLCSTFYYYSFLSSLFYRIFFVLSYFSFDYLPLVKISTSVTPMINGQATRRRTSP